MNRLSAVIITHNEERNIGRCIESLRGVADEIVVVDSGSTDGTESICREHGAFFQFHPWQDYSSQKNFAESLAHGQWILSIDADEALDDQLRQSVIRFLDSNPPAGQVGSFRRLNNYCGQWIRHGGWYPDEKVRLWRRGICCWEGVVHEELRFAAPVTTVRLAGQLLHYTYASVSELADRHQRYAMLAAEKAHAKGKRCGAGALWLRPMWTFVRNYIFKLGFLDGRGGYEVCRITAYYTFLKYARLRELNMNR